MNKIKKALSTPKPTRATIKTFVREAREAGTLHISVRSRFDGMTDGVEYLPASERGPKPAVADDHTHPSMLDHTLGVRGVWLVGQSRDYISREKVGEFEGFEVSNCCGSWFVGVPA